MSNIGLDPIQLQRLVDGELPSVDQVALLRQLDREPANWRILALALLEEQVFRRELGSTSTSLVASLRESAGETSLPIAGEASKRLRSPWLRGWLAQPLMIAASLLLLVTGYFAGAGLRGHADRIGNVADPNGSRLVNDSRQPSSNGEDVGTLRLVSQEPESRSVEIPIYQVSELEPSQVYGADPRALMELRRQLRQRGMDLDIETELLEGELADGRKLIVPVRNVNLRSYGQ